MHVLTFRCPSSTAPSSLHSSLPRYRSALTSNFMLQPAAICCYNFHKAAAAGQEISTGGSNSSERCGKVAQLASSWRKQLLEDALCGCSVKGGPWRKGRWTLTYIRLWRVCPSYCARLHCGQHEEEPFHYQSREHREWVVIPLYSADGEHILLRGKPQALSNLCCVLCFFSCLFGT